MAGVGRNSKNQEVAKSMRLDALVVLYGTGIPEKLSLIRKLSLLSRQEREGQEQNPASSMSLYKMPSKSMAQTKGISSYLKP